MPPELRFAVIAAAVGAGLGRHPVLGCPQLLGVALRPAAQAELVRCRFLTKEEPLSLDDAAERLAGLIVDRAARGGQRLAQLQSDLQRALQLDPVDVPLLRHKVVKAAIGAVMGMRAAA